MRSQGTGSSRKPKLSNPLSAFTANPQQTAAIEHTTGPAAFIAAAGTGKTSVLVQRLIRLVARQGVAPEKILCVTFTRAAADEMEKRAIKALKAHGLSAQELKAVRVVTFHGLGHQMLREKLQWAPQELNKRLISGDPRQWLAEDIVRPWRSNRTRGMNWDVDIAGVLAAVDRAKEELIKPAQSLEFFQMQMGFDNEIAQHYGDFYQLYEETKRKEKLYDLSDLIYVPLTMLEGSPTYRKTWQGRFEYLQVDETQDTNPSQYKLISYLSAPKQNVVVVGDPDQAIYQFRGASPEASILSFRTMYPQGKLYPIELNYRSTPQILDAANRLISHNDVTPGFEKSLRATQPEGEPIQVLAYEDQEQEAEGIAHQIRTLTRSGSSQGENLSFRDIFILSRTNHHLASLEIALARARVPYRTLGGSSFFKRKTTRDMLAYLTLIDGVRIQQEYLHAREQVDAPKWSTIFTPVHCGEQNAAFRIVANIPSQDYFARTGKASHRFTPTFFGTLTVHAQGKPLLQFCDEQAYTIAAEHQFGVKDLVALLKRAWQQSQNNPVKAIRAIREIAYNQHLRQRDARHREEADEETEAPREPDERHLEGRYDELEEIEQFAAKHRSIRHFLDAMNRLKEQAEDVSKNKRDCVTLMTIHKAKGLESPVVFVMGLTEGIFPHRRSFTLAEDGPVVVSGIAEERRLAYVAFTRARRLLILSTLRRYRGSDATPSRFLQEADLTPTLTESTLNPFLWEKDGSSKKTPDFSTPTLF